MGKVNGSDIIDLMVQSFIVGIIITALFCLLAL
jgi:hypothetical protein